MPTITITEKQQAITASRATDEWNHAGGEWDDVVVFFTNTSTVGFRVTADFNRDGSFHEARAAKHVVVARDGRIQRVVTDRATTADWNTFFGWISLL